MTPRPELVQTAWARVLVCALADAGVEAVVVSPGSRSTPLTAALAAQEALAVHVVVDERAAGFFALGLGRARRAPVALVCTSGTAAAHYYPAVIEAEMAGVPLVVVSADRPPELHGGGAPQTIDQTRLFGEHVRAFADLGPPHGTEIALRALRRRVAQTVLASLSPRRGPVHLNVPLRKPLEPARPIDDAEVALLARAEAIATRAPVAPPPCPAQAADDAIAALAAALGRARRPVIVAGPGDLGGAATAVSRLARRAGAVVWAETASGLRGAVDDDVARLDAFALVMGTPELRARLRPDLIVRLGAEPVAPSWPGVIASLPDVPRWVITEHAWPDPDASAAGVVIGDVVATLEHVAATIPLRAPAGDDAWREAVRLADETAWAVVDDLLAAPAALPHEGAAVRAVLDACGDATIVLGNSLPVRLVDQVWRPRRALRALSQRGAAGIDGLIAGAVGAAAAGRPVVLLVGDVSFAHDVGSLALLRHRAVPILIVVIDNGGGRIFESLPVVDAIPADRFDALWLTPPGLDPVAVARAFGVPARAVRSPDELRAHVAAAPRLGTAVLHVPVAPSSARELRAAAIARLTAAAATLGAPDRAPASAAEPDDPRKGATP
ncbi:MAG: 2-succinyl-5-enolpyruvyl-6-hydroxy-3-cyclohexene-1-carboxylic-acid synthase [Kofleriaceae bacterium]|nr:2-succinyl-5-enolpyruvyl-6-hydroxy-3-cyclohexene-1-carboxylic-acid synthase [Kofleriaceae bacterium]MCB9573668.1 2-succinyl-5-enolpyruvyl-6-hydroxy-3-cyclohexene-1-carboxylic-acid synthase [Kofleriaceae bacterium]